MFLNRFLLYDFLNKDIISGGPIQYLEFGVYKGETIKYFANINSNIDSRFIGFDSFTGLPEAWQEPTGTMQANTFDIGGKMPQTTDGRISFVKGYFQTSLPGFLQEYQAVHPLVMHIDCDLYSSTLYVLTLSNHLLVPGSIVIFDEFFSVMHEFRALEDYCSSYMRDYTVVATTKGCGQIAIRMH